MRPNPQETWSHLLKKSLMENFIFCTVRILQQMMLQLRQNTKKDRH